MLLIGIIQIEQHVEYIGLNCIIQMAHSVIKLLERHVAVLCVVENDTIEDSLRRRQRNYLISNELT